MASNYTCRACSRALANAPSIIQVRRPPPNPAPSTPPYRSLSTSPRWAYHATPNLKKQAIPSSTAKGNEPPKREPTDAEKQAFLRARLSTKLPAAHALAQKLRQKAPLMTETYVAYGATQKLLAECARHGDYTIPQAQQKGGEIPTDETGAHLGVGTGWWYDTLGLAPTFINWAQITFLHMYMLQVRFRMFPATHAPIWIQHLTNHAFYAAEDRLVFWHQLNASSLRQKYLKDLFAQWRGVLLSYDEGLVKGDAVLATAIWRNLLGGREDVDFEMLAQVVAYMRRNLGALDRALDDDVANGSWAFPGNPGDEEGVVKARSNMANEALKKA